MGNTGRRVGGGDGDGDGDYGRFIKTFLVMFFMVRPKLSDGCRGRPSSSIIILIFHVLGLAFGVPWLRVKLITGHFFQRSTFHSSDSHSWGEWDLEEGECSPLKKIALGGAQFLAPATLALWAWCALIKPQASRRRPTTAPSFPWNMMGDTDCIAGESLFLLQFHTTALIYMTRSNLS
jgi:hypothetical protein